MARLAWVESFTVEHGLSIFSRPLELTPWRPGLEFGHEPS